MTLEVVSECVSFDGVYEIFIQISPSQLHVLS